MRRFKWLLAGVLVVVLAGTAYAALNWTATLTGTATGEATGAGSGIVNPISDAGPFVALSPKVVVGGEVDLNGEPGTWEGSLVVAYYGGEAVLTGDIQIHPDGGDTIKGEAGGHWVYSDHSDDPNTWLAIRAHSGKGKNATHYQGVAVGRIEDGGNNMTELDLYLGTATE